MTNTSDLGSLTYPDGYFLLRPSAQRQPYIPADTAAGLPYRHVFSYAGSQPAIKETAIDLVKSARWKIYVASFLIGEPDLLDALYAAADRLRGGVYVISALDDNTLRQGIEEIEDERASDTGDFRARKKRFEDLTRRGIAVRGHENCHAKFLVADDREALVSSANLETPALSGSPDRGVTGESGALIADPEEVARLSRFFTRLWYSCTFEMPPGEGYTVQGRHPQPSPCRVPIPPNTPGPGVIWTHHGEHAILAAVHDIITRARRQILLATYGMNSVVDHPELLVDPLRKILRTRSIDVALLVRARNNIPAHRQAAAVLADMGVRICADSLNHAKAAIADEEYGALFSANFDAAHGMLGGVEAGVRLDGQPALAEAARYLQHAMTHSDQIFEPHPTQRQMDQYLGGRWRTPWPHEQHIRVTAANSAWERFRAAAASAPVLYTDTGNDRVTLHAGRGQWQLSPRADDGVRGLEFAGAGGSAAAEQLASWLSPPRGKREKQKKQPDERRGLCPAVISHI